MYRDGKFKIATCNVIIMTLGLAQGLILNESWPVELLLVHEWHGTAKNLITASYQEILDSLQLLSF